MANLELSAAEVKAAKPKLADYKMPDGKGLHLYVTSKGVKSWRWRYSVNGVDRLIVLGQYPDMTLAQARDRRDDYRRDVREGREPGGKVVVAKSDTLLQVAQRWHDKRATVWTRGRTASDVWRRLERHVFPKLGDVPIRDIKQAQLLAVLEGVEQAGRINTAGRTLGSLVRIWDQAIGEEQTADNPARRLLGVMAERPATTKRPRLTEIAELREVLRRCEEQRVHPLVKLAHRLTALTAQRVEQVVAAEWEQIKGIGTNSHPEWVNPGAAMKKVKTANGEMPAHTVPLSRQAVEVLDAARTLSFRDRYIFPQAAEHIRYEGLGSGHLSQGSLRRILVTAGYATRHCPHGWRGSFATIMHKLYRRDEMEIELMIAHKAKSNVREAYDDNEYMERRRELAQIWADMLMEGASPAADLLKLPLARELVG